MGLANSIMRLINNRQKKSKKETCKSAPKCTLKRKKKSIKSVFELGWKNKRVLWRLAMLVSALAPSRCWLLSLSLSHNVYLMVLHQFWFQDLICCISKGQGLIWHFWNSFNLNYVLLNYRIKTLKWTLFKNLLGLFG